MGDERSDEREERREEREVRGERREERGYMRSSKGACKIKKILKVSSFGKNFLFGGTRRAGVLKLLILAYPQIRLKPTCVPLNKI